MSVFISAALNQFYLTSVFLDTIWTTIKWSLLALNLPAFLPRALEIEKGHPMGHNTLCSHSEKLQCCSFLITHESCLCVNPFHNSTPQPQVRGQVLLKLFISSPRSCITVALTQDNVAWVCCGKFYRRSCIYDMFSHLVPWLS